MINFWSNLGRNDMKELVGWATEFAMLRDYLLRAVQGQGSTFFVEGVAGIGKSMLLTRAEEATANEWC